MTIRFVALALISVLVLGGLFFVVRPDPPAANSGERTFDVRITEDGMDPEEVSVREGDRVMLNVTAEKPVELHVHGYDLEKEVEPGEVGTLSFEAESTGRFPVEEHDSEEELGTLIVRPR